jgi:hypothetical protein
MITSGAGAANSAACPRKSAAVLHLLLEKGNPNRMRRDSFTARSSLGCMDRILRVDHVPTIIAE